MLLPAKEESVHLKVLLITVTREQGVLGRFEQEADLLKRKHEKKVQRRT